MLAGFMNHMCALRAHGNLTVVTRNRAEFDNAGVAIVDPFAG
jgi:hypothetical protein